MIKDAATWNTFQSLLYVRAGELRSQQEELRRGVYGILGDLAAIYARNGKILQKDVYESARHYIATERIELKGHAANAAVREVTAELIPIFRKASGVSGPLLGG